MQAKIITGLTFNFLFIDVDAGEFDRNNQASININNIGMIIAILPATLNEEAKGKHFQTI
jgi:hypothetical protein